MGPICLWTSISSSLWNRQRRGTEIPEKLLVLPVIAYGYTGHVMDFPGHDQHALRDVYSPGFGCHEIAGLPRLQEDYPPERHGSNMPNLDLAARRTNLETDADCVLVAWWNLLKVDPAFMPSWRESKFPGGCSHACELETSLYLYLDEANVRKEKIKSGTISFNEEENPFNWVDLFGTGSGNAHLMDEQLFANRRFGRRRESDEGKRRAGLQRSG